MKSASRLVITAGFMMIAACHAWGGDVKVIANESVKVDSISSAELRSLFLLQSRSLKDGSAVEPVLQKHGPAHEAFMKQCLHRDSNEIRFYYQGLVFTGKGSMPKQLDSDAEVVAYVARTKGAIGYVSSSANTDGAKVLVVGSEEVKQERTLLTRVEPDYPETLQRLGIGGIVRLQLSISPKGTVENAAVLGGNPILAEAAVKAAKQWIYSAGPSRTTIQVSIPFQARP